MTPTSAHHAIFPGSFDPFTLGHRDLVERALSIFGRVTVAIGAHHEKGGLFTIETRLDLARLLGATRQSVSKELKRLEQQGFVEIRYGRFYILDLPALNEQFEESLGMEQLSPFYHGTDQET